MTTNHASGGVRRRSERSQGSRQNTAAKGTAPPPLGRGRPTAFTATTLLALDRGPGRNPLVVWDAVFASIRAGGVGRLPDVDGVDVRARVGGVVLGGRAGLQGVHLAARRRADGRRAGGW